MEHRHLNTYELFNAALDEKASGMKPPDCDYCNARAKKAGYLLYSLRKKNLSGNDNLYNSLISKARTKDDFLSFISESAHSGETIRFKPGKKRIKFLIPISAGLVAACLCVFLNFMYYFFIPEENFISADGNVNITRKGYAAGEMNIKSGMILPGDTINNNDGDVYVNTKSGAHVFAKQFGRFGFRAEGNIFISALHNGRFFVAFDRMEDKRYIVELPFSDRMIITGTQVFCNADDEEYEIYMHDGNAKLETAVSSIELSRGNSYTVKQDGSVNAESVSREEADALLKPFADMDNFSSIRKEYINPTGEATSETGNKTAGGKKPERKKATLNDLKRQYGTLSVITTKTGKKYIGAFTMKKDKIEIITVDGRVVFPSSEVENLSPYEK